ncbi:hypothetical protein P8C59_008233 [Phyllachora maydis]|uniref:Integrase catalytic domain-containing protein n=1 Tax=Phyllachora maydis TaxID=1825666 RepID=A0AAD9MJG8_9PEZI|nr:hypothetical protein P8C59_008233 [Phyllachora maydis]
MLGLTASSLNIEYLMADILEESRNPATEAYRAAHVANSSNSTPNSNSNPSKKGKNKKKGKKKASYNVEGQNYSAKSAEQASFMLESYNLAIEQEEESDSSSNSSSSSDSDTQLAQLLALKGYKKRKDFKGKGLKTSSNNKAKYKDNKPRRRPRDPALYNIIEGNKVVEKAISSPTLKEPNIGQRDYYNLLNLAKLWHVRLGHIGLRLLKKTSSITKGLPNFDKIKEADFHCSSCDRGKAVRRVSKALIPDPPRVLDSIEGDTVKIRPRPYNRNPIVLLLVDRKSRYRWVFNLPNKSGPIVANAIKGFFRGLRNGFGRYPTKFHFDGGTEITDLLTTYLVERSVRVILDRPITNEPLDNSDLILEGDKMQLDYYKLLAKTSSYILSFVYKARKRVISKDTALSACIALYAKAKAKAEKEEEEEEEKEEEEKEDKKVVKEEKDVRGRGKEDKGSYTHFELLLPYLTISIVATSHIPSKGNSQVIAQS